MKQTNTGYLIWSEERESYLVTTTCKYPFEFLREISLSEIHVNSVPLILQAIWCKRKGYVNHRIGITKEEDQKIARELNVWE